MKLSTSIARSKARDRSLTILLWAIALLFHPHAIALSQTSSTGAVYGRVLDRNGAVMIGAEVELRNSATGQSQKQLTNSSGQFVFSHVLPGEYGLVVRRSGFRQSVVSGLKVEVTKGYGSAIVLEVGDVTETVNVVAGAGAELQRTDATIGSVASSKILLYLPSLERNAVEFLTLQPGTTPEAGDGDNGSRGGAVTGARTDQSTFTLDGIDITENSTGGGAGFRTMIPVPVDSVEEFRAGVTNPNASFGRSSGGQVSLVGRRGSNEFHGAFYWYHQNDNLNANSWTNNRSGVAEAELKDNRYGFRVGGPLRRNRSFFFVGYESRNFSRPFDVTRIVPTETLRRGIVRFRDNAGNVVSYDLATSTLCGSGNNGRCDPRRLGMSPSVSALWSLLPPGNDPGSGDGLNTTGWRSTADAPLNNDYVVGRYDHELTDNWWLNASATYSRRLSTLGGPGGLRQQLDIRGNHAIFTGDAPLRGQNLTLGLTGSFTPTATGSLKFGWTRDRQSSAPINPSAVASFLGIPGTSTGAGHVALNIGGGNLDQLVSEPVDVDSQRARTQSNDNQSFQLVYDGTWIRGTHSIQFGSNSRHLITRHTRNDKVVGSLASLVADVSRGSNIAIPASSRPPTCSTPSQINCLRSTDVGQWDALFAGVTGMIDSVSIMNVRDGKLNPLPFGTALTADATHNAYEFYFQDTWQVKPSLALTLGLSYGWQRPPQDRLGRQTQMINTETGELLTYENYIEPRRQAALRGEIYNPQIGFQAVTSPGSSSRGELFKTDWNNLAPRLAAAWSPSFKNRFFDKLFGDRMTVLRGGFGILYDRINTSESVILPALGAGFSQTLNLRAPPCNSNGAGGPGCSPTGTAPASVFRVGVDGTIPLPVQPAASFPFIPGQPFGETLSFQIDPNFDVGENYSFDFTLQRQLPRGFSLEVGWVGRLGRRLPASVNFNSSPFFHLDRLSGQTFAQAFDAVAQLLRTGVPAASVSPQPWFQNNMPGGTARVITGNEANFINGNVSNIFQTIDLARLSGSLTPFNNLQTQTAFVRTSLGRSNYHALVMILRKRPAAGLTVDFNYTFSKSLDQSSALQNSTNTLQNAFFPDFDYGPSDFDRTHIINSYFLYEIPTGRGHLLHSGEKLDKVLGGWFISGIFRAASGLPLVVSQGASALGGGSTLVTTSGAIRTTNISNIRTGVNTGVPGSNNVGTNGNPAAGGSGINLFADPEAAFSNFRRVLLSRDGRSGRANPLRGFPFWNLDLSLGKTTRINENIEARFSLDFFNAFNHVVFSNPTLDLTNSRAFGVVTQQNAPTRREASSRWVQIGLRLEF
ncbi:MAG TPA: carboxypeptidase-like regulatory domain-containing protein [Pyrinomonadaceae bacterium]|nr:carboxypeptidase-like regulatory domain-containing protein [Pyrinomonadaceae bacterium]